MPFSSVRVGFVLPVVFLSVIALAIALSAGAGWSGEPAALPAAKAPAPTTASAPAGDKATRRQVENLIEQAGKTPPPWWDSVPLNYPLALDLTWPQPKGPWNPNKHVPQYFWGVVQPNQAKWKEGVRLCHHLLVVNKDNPRVLSQAMSALGKFYYDLQDYPRAAFWLRKPNVDAGLLAHCYWKLGSKSMAQEVLETRLADDDEEGIILYAQMGELAKALDWAGTMAAAGEADSAYLLAGNACRSAGKYEQALEYYTKVAGVKQGSRRLAKHKEAAAASAAAVRLIKDIDPRKIPDGTYSAASPGFRGPVTVEVTVKGGRIESVKVTQHKEDLYFFHIANNVLPKSIVERQGFAGVDAVSGATVTSDAMINAAGKALAGGAKAK